MVKKGSLFVVIHNGLDIIGDILAGFVDVSFGIKSTKERDIFSTYQLNSKNGLMFIGIPSIAENFARHHRFLLVINVSNIMHAELELVGDNNHTDIFPTENGVLHFSRVSQVEDPGKIMFIGGSAGCASKLVITQESVRNTRGISHGTGIAFYNTKNKDGIVKQVLTNINSQDYKNLSSRHRSVNIAVNIMEKAGLV